MQYKLILLLILCNKLFCCGMHRNLEMALEQDNLHTTKILLSQDNIEEINGPKQTPLIITARRNSLRCLEYIFTLNPNINAQDNAKWTALMYACFFGYKEFVEELIKHNPDLNRLNSENENAFMIAIKRDHLEIAKKIVPLNINQQNRASETALILACNRLNLRSVKFILKQNANPDLQDWFEETALHKAAKNAHEEIIKILLKNEARTDIKNNNYLTPEKLLPINCEEKIRQLFDSEID